MTLQLRVEAKLQNAMERVRLLLKAEKTPQLAADVHHQYEDKYFLVERGTCLAAASQLNCLASLGLQHLQLQTLQQWAQTHSVSLRLRSKETCTFLREEKREEENPRKHVEEVSRGGVLSASWTSKVVTTITEYFWNFQVTYTLEAFRGVGADDADRISLCTRSGQAELKTSSKTPPPHPEVRSPAINEEVNITWLLQSLTANAAPSFKIDRAASNCSTPRRNTDVDKAFAHFTMFARWAQSVSSYLGKLRNVKPRTGDDSAVSAEKIFVPTLPIMVSGNTTDEPAGDHAGTLALLSASSEMQGSLVLCVSDGNRLLGEELRSLEEQKANLAEVFPLEGLYTRAEAAMHVTLMHCSAVSEGWGELVEYVEGMLRKQLVAAIGKEVSPALFAAYMRFHYRKLFREEFQPSQFCFAVRRSERHSPEGTISIEEQTLGLDEASIRTPIVTFANCSSTPVSMSFPLNASTKVAFDGNVHLHGWLSHRFSGQSGAEVFLASRARQFSSFLVLAGRITSATTFDPSYAAIVQNKDELTIPLELSMIPTPKEFKDAISSLSPEMQSFAKSFRSMQLESTLFGVVVVQIKPQLEKLLNLAEDSLTKEIKLTQDLMELFMKYQIPSDLLSFDEEASGDLRGPKRVDVVKGHVQAMTDMINAEKQAEVEAARQAALYANPFPGGPGVLRSSSSMSYDEDALTCGMRMECDSDLMEECEEGHGRLL
ncbi:unnamed protein product [Effrenium voratum]|nr:unnamed protein product [Effrenium voratum]